MKLFIALFLLIVVIANVELCVFLTLGAKIGLLPTILIIVGTGTIGAWLAKKEISRSWANIKQSFSSGKNLSTEVINGLCLLLAGLALLIPGFISDMCGLLLLVPWIRKPLVRKISSKWKPMSFFTVNGNTWSSAEQPANEYHASSDDDVIDVEAKQSSQEYL